MGDWEDGEVGFVRNVAALGCDRTPPPRASAVQTPPLSPGTSSPEATLSSHGAAGPFMSSARLGKGDQSFGINLPGGIRLLHLF